MKKIIVFNWKMNPETYDKAEILTDIVIRAAQGKNAEVVLCEPFPWLTDIAHKNKGIVRFGAQNVFWENSGAYTGEVSPLMLKSSGVEYVIIGHSERRRHMGETDLMVNKKVKAALGAGLKAILCAGETQQMAGNKQPVAKTRGFVEKQLLQDLAGIDKLSSASRKLLVIAYEPVWAIGTGKPCNPEYAAEMVRFIKSFANSRLSLSVPVVYGGSVDGKNIKNYVQYKEIDGVLAGGAGLKAGEIKKMIEVVASLDNASRREN